jgi:hypothetical protein
MAVPAVENAAKQIANSVALVTVFFTDCSAKVFIENITRGHLGKRRHFKPQCNTC